MFVFPTLTMVRLHNILGTLILSLVLLCLAVHPLHAQGSVSLSVTPTLFDISVDPGQVWSSSVRVINPNTTPLTVFVEPVNFTSSGEGGLSSFYRIEEPERVGATLPEWFELEQASITIEPQGTGRVPFTVWVPEDASPGGQYAALLISTQPPPDSAEGSQVRTTQAVSSLFFMRVSGEVSEQGRVRSFFASERVTERPRNEFVLRFENQGTVHLQPQGTITIYNMWGQERGEIPINQGTQFGKVLPDDIRSFSFGWEGVFSLLDIGRYRAEVTLAYGSEERSFTSAEATFWVIPIMGLLAVLGSLTLIILMVLWLIRRYVRRVLMISGVDPDDPRGVRPRPGDVKLSSSAETISHEYDDTASNSKVGFSKWFAPLVTLVTDWKTKWRSADSLYARISAIGTILHTYRILLVAIVVIIVALLLAVLFFRTVLDPARSFEVTITTGTTGEVVNSEELAWERLLTEGRETTDLPVTREPLSKLSDTGLTIEIVNVSGVSGLAASVAYELARYLPAEDLTLGTDLSRSERRSVILFNPEHTDEAQVLSQAMGGALLSSYPAEQEPEVDITILVGTDIRP